MSYGLSARLESLDLPECSNADCDLVARRNLIWSIGDRESEPIPLCLTHAAVVLKEIDALIPTR